MAEILLKRRKSSIQSTNQPTNRGNCKIFEPRQLQNLRTTKPTNPWIKSINNMLHNLGFSCLINNSITLKPYMHSIKQIIIDQCLQEQNAKICSSSKLSFFQNFYILNNRANYVDKLINKCDRSTISRIRLSAHQLAIEKGRYSNVPKSERYCLACNNHAFEDEEHFLLQCQAYSILREKLGNNLQRHFINFNKLDTNGKLQTIINSSSTQVLRMYSSFISQCLENRKTIVP